MLDDLGSSMQSGITDFDFLTIRRRQTRDTKKKLIVPKGAPRGIDRSMPCSTPGSIRCGQPDPLDTTAFDPSQNNRQNLGVSEVNSRIIINVKGYHSMTFAFETSLNTVVTAEQVKEDSPTLKSFACGAKQISQKVTPRKAFGPNMFVTAVLDQSFGYFVIPNGSFRILGNWVRRLGSSNITILPN